MHNYKDNVSVHYNGIGFTGLLTLVFIVLKLTGIIKWSLVWVLCPLWISAIMYIIILIVVYLVLNR